MKFLEIEHIWTNLDKTLFSVLVQLRLLNDLGYAFKKRDGISGE